MIEGKVINLRPMEESDMQCLQDMLNDSAVSGKVVGWSFPVSMTEQKEWFQKAIHDANNKRFIVADKKTNAPLGMVTLSKIDWQNRSATHGIKLHPSCPKGQGIGTDAVMTLMKYAFEEVNLIRLDGSWMADNLASENLYLKCGWVIEGVKKQAVYRNGIYHDLKIVGITKEDYLSLVRKNQ